MLFMVAICGGAKCIEKAQAAYFSKKGKGPNYLRLLASVVGKKPLGYCSQCRSCEFGKKPWPPICTFADENEFPDLCEALR